MATAVDATFMATWKTLEAHGEQPTLKGVVKLSDSVEVEMISGFLELRVRTGCKTDVRSMIPPSAWFDYRIDFMWYVPKEDQICFRLGHFGDSFSRRGLAAVKLAEFVQGTVITQVMSERKATAENKLVKQTIRNFMNMVHEIEDDEEDGHSQAILLIHQMNRAVDIEQNEKVKKLLAQIMALADASFNTASVLLNHLKMILGTSPEVMIHHLTNTNWDHFQAVRSAIGVMDQLMYQISGLSKIEQYGKNAAIDAEKYYAEGKLSARAEPTEEKIFQMTRELRESRRRLREIDFTEDFSTFEKRFHLTLDSVWEQDDQAKPM